MGFKAIGMSNYSMQLINDLCKIICKKESIKSLKGYDYRKLSTLTTFNEKTIRNWVSGKNVPKETNLNILSYHLLNHLIEKKQITPSEELKKLIDKVSNVNEIGGEDFYSEYIQIKQKGLIKQDYGRDTMPRRTFMYIVIPLVTFVLGSLLSYFLFEQKSTTETIKHVEVEKYASHKYTNDDLFAFINDSTYRIEEIWMSGGHLFKTVAATKDAIEELVRTKTPIKILFMTKDSDAVNYARLRYPNLRTRSRFNTNIEATERNLNQIIDQYGKVETLEVKTIDFNMDERIIIINPNNDDAIAYVKTYPFKDEEGVDYGGLFTFYPKNEMPTEYDFYLNKFNKYLEDAVDFTFY